jgi:hypothetical protein
MKEITPDTGLAVAVERNVTGASTHKLHNLLHQYQLACYMGNYAMAESTELTLRRTLLNSELRRYD